MMLHIHTLTAGDAVAYRDLRLRALRHHPIAFATTYEEERSRSLALMAEILVPGPNQVTLGAIQQSLLMGIVTMVRPAKAKLRHRATITAMYVVPEARGQKVSQLLLEQVLRVAADWGVTDVKLGVTVGNYAAKSLYTRAGFITYALEPRCLYVEGCYYDVEWMILPMNHGTCL